MKVLSNDYRSVIFIFVIISLASQLMSCEGEVTSADTNENVTPATGRGGESTKWFPLKQKGDGIYRITVGSDKEKLYIEITDDSFSITDAYGKGVEGCKMCTDEFRQQFKLGETCEGAEERFNVKMCSTKALRQCPSGHCEYHYGGARFCWPCF
jgi:hypothetical protein